MTGLILVCMIHHNASWFGINIRRDDFLVRSQVHCTQIARELGRNWDGIGTVMSYDLDRESDRKQFTIRCGIEGKDCKDLRND